MKNNNKEQKIGAPSKPATNKRAAWVQTEQSSHEAWARLTLENNKAAALMHLVVSRMDRSTNAIVASHQVLAELMKCSTRSIKNYIAVLEKERWLQRVSLGKGSVNALVVNSAVAWGKDRENMRFSAFTAQVIASRDDQDSDLLSDIDLRKIPVLFPGESQMPHKVSASEQRPVQCLLEGTEPDLPAIKLTNEETPD